MQRLYKLWVVNRETGRRAADMRVHATSTAEALDMAYAVYTSALFTAQVYACRPIRRRGVAR